MRSITFVTFTLISILTGAAAAQHAEVFPRAEVFGEGTLSVGQVFRGSFSSDGKTFYFFKKVAQDGEEYKIFRSEFANGKWSKPESLDLGGDFSDLYPSVSKDGKRLLFISYRPAPGDTSAKPNAYLWYADLTPSGWGDPVFIKRANLFGSYHSWAEFGSRGEIYFRRVSPDWRTKTTLVSRWNGKEYADPSPFQPAEQWRGWKEGFELAGGSPGPTPETVFLDVATRDAATGRTGSDIYVSFRRKGQWSDPVPLAGGVNEVGYETFPFFSPDGKTMYFVRDFEKFYRVSLASAIGNRK